MTRIKEIGVAAFWVIAVSCVTITVMNIVRGLIR